MEEITKARLPAIVLRLLHGRALKKANKQKRKQRIHQGVTLQSTPLPKHPLVFSTFEMKKNSPKKQPQQEYFCKLLIAGTSKN